MRPASAPFAGPGRGCRRPPTRAQGLAVWAAVPTPAGAGRAAWGVGLVQRGGRGAATPAWSQPGRSVPLTTGAQQQPLELPGRERHRKLRARPAGPELTGRAQSTRGPRSQGSLGWGRGDRQLRGHHHWGRWCKWPGDAGLWLRARVPARCWGRRPRGHTGLPDPVTRSRTASRSPACAEGHTRSCDQGGPPLSDLLSGGAGGSADGGHKHPKCRRTAGPLHARRRGPPGGPGQTRSPALALLQGF